MPEPNLPPLRLADGDDEEKHRDRPNVGELRSAMPELPADTRRRYVEEFGIPLDMASRLVNEPALSSFIDEALAAAARVDDPKVLANLVLIALPDVLGERPLAETRLKAGQLAELTNAKTRGDLVGEHGKLRFDTHVLVG